MREAARKDVERKRITVLHNQDARTGHYRHGDRLAEVYTRLLPADWSMRTPDLLAEALFWVFRAVEPAELLTLNAEERPLNSTYRNRRLRSFVRGDVLVIDSDAFVCGPWGRAIAVPRSSLKVASSVADARRMRRVAANACP